ncbi:MAG: DNA gyrase subunit A [Patescibacteria group bacterium]|nr:DNA gyrase subunit A [Patescibacteria group bacterium]
MKAKKVEDQKREIGYIKSRKITEEMKTSYLDYAMSTIVARALPDVRDGLKPSQRRILYSMHKLGLAHNTKYRKSALVVGDVLGKYHPHGDASVYEAMVRLAQDFSLRYPLVDGQGNFGSVDGDSPAQMRYTECRMTAIAEELLKNIEKDTVNFIDNYDASRKEPQVLPAALPQLLINGAVGIAVGMATNIPPHNVGEVTGALIYLIDHAECEVENLLEFIKGPDFPTGGIAYSQQDITEAYATGRGRVVTRAKCNIVETKKERFNIVVSELTYQSNKAATITKIADLVKSGRINGIRDIRDESDKEGIRVVIELKKDAYPKKVLNKLYHLTDLQKNFGFNMLALEGGIQPRVMNVKEMLGYFLDHRIEVVTRRTRFDLNKAKDRAHILEGLQKAINNIDAVIKIIKASKDKQVARVNLIEKFKFTDIQVEAILEMKLQTLAGLERKKIDDELAEKKKLIKILEDLLKSKKKIKGVVKEELAILQKEYRDERKTKIIKNKVGEFSDEDLVPEEDAIIMMSRGGYIKRMSPDTYKVQKRGGVGIIGAATKEDDVIDFLFTVRTHDSIYFFSETGKVYLTKAFEINESSRLSKGQAIANFLSLSQKERVTAILAISSKMKAKYLFMGTKMGLVKKVELEKFTNIRTSGIAAIRLKKGDELQWVNLTSGKDEVMIVTEQGQAIRFKEEDVRSMGRAAAGVRGIKMKEDDRVIGVDVIPYEKTRGKKLLVITKKGYGKKTSISKYKIQKRGGSGLKTMKIVARNGKIAHASLVCKDEGVTDIIATSSHGNIIRIETNSISELGRVTQGVKVMRLKSGDELAQATLTKATKI